MNESLEKRINAAQDGEVIPMTRKELQDSKKIINRRENRMWPFRKRKQNTPACNCDEKITDLYRRLAELNTTVNALIAENRIDRDIPDKIQVILGQYREISRRLQNLETNMQPVFAFVRSIREFTDQPPEGEENGNKRTT